MLKKKTLRAALVMMCAIAFSVCMDSCQENGIDNHENENSYCLNVDSNGVKFTVTPFLDWDATMEDVQDFMAKNHPDYVVYNDGILEYDSISKSWNLFYDNGPLYMGFYFLKESGNELCMTDFGCHVSSDIENVQNELVRSGFKYKGKLFFDDVPHLLTYLYLTPDESLEVQLTMNNDESECLWFVCFQRTYKGDFDYLIDESALSINYKDTLGTYAVTPFTDWDATLADVKDFMSEYYPDWGYENGEELILDTTYADTVQNWYTAFGKDRMSVIFFFKDEEGQKYDFVQFVYYGSTDLKPLQREMTRNGLRYIGKETAEDAEIELSGCVYAPLGNEYMVVIESWNMYGGCWTLNFCPYEEDFISTLDKW